MPPARVVGFGVRADRPAFWRGLVMCPQGASPQMSAPGDLLVGRRGPGLSLKTSSTELVTASSGCPIDPDIAASEKGFQPFGVALDRRAQPGKAALPRPRGSRASCHRRSSAAAAGSAGSAALAAVAAYVAA